jgi:RHS repeat-associated protein
VIRFQSHRTDINRIRLLFVKIAETDGSGTPLRDYVYLNGERIAMKVYGTQAGWYYFINDHLGTPQKIVDSAGNVVWAAAYLPFGEALIITEIVVNNFRFPGQYYDAETGLHCNWHRYYDPRTGRYITADPIGLDGGVNLYAYVEGNPVNLTDPDGQNPLAILAAIWAVVEAALSASDAVTTVQTVIDPCASGAEKASSVGLFALGMVAPGGGYSTAGKNVICIKLRNNFLTFLKFPAK